VRPRGEAEGGEVTPAQCRAARGLLGWRRSQLEVAGVDDRTIRRFENGEVAPRPASLLVMRLAFEAAGIIFTEEDDEGGLGVRLRRKLP
jgi:hypothetical protein